MSKIGDLYVMIGADTSSLRRGVRQAEKSIDRMRNRMRSASLAAAKFGGAIAAAGLAISTALVARSFQTVDALAKVSDRLGIATEQLAGLRRAAELSGVSANTLDMALQRMTRRVAEAAQGSGEAQDAIKELGLSAVELAKMTPDEQIRTFSDALAGVESQSDKVRIAFKLFDSEGVALLNTLAMGSDEINRVTQESLALGTALSRVDAAQIERANDAMSGIREVITGAANRIAVHLAPWLEVVANRLRASALESDGFRSEINRAVESAIQGMSRFADALQAIHRIWTGLRAASDLVFTIWTRMFRAIVRIITRTVDAAISSINLLIKGANKIPGIDMDLFPLMEDLSAFKVMDDFVDESIRAADESRKAFEEAWNAPLASKFFDDLLADVRAIPGITSEELAKARQTLDERMGTLIDSGLGGVALPTGQGGGSDKNAGLAGRLEALRDYFASEKELEEKRYAEQLETLYAAREAQMITEQEFRDIELQAAMSHEEALTEIEKKASEDRQRIAEQERQQRLRGYSQMFGDLASLMNTGSKKLFAIGKAAAIANAIMEGYQAAVSAWKWGMSAGGPPLAAAATAASLAATGAQIANIRSQQIGGAGGAANSYVNGQPATNVTPAGGPTQTVMVQGINDSDLFSGSRVRSLAETLLEYQSNGGRIVFA